MIYNEARLQRSEVCCEADTSAHTVVEPTEEVTGSGLASGLQLQRAAHAEFPNVVRLFELDCCAIPLRTAGGGGIFAVLAGAVAVLDLGHRRAKSRCPSQKAIGCLCSKNVALQTILHTAAILFSGFQTGFRSVCGSEG